MKWNSYTRRARDLSEHAAFKEPHSLKEDFRAIYGADITPFSYSFIQPIPHIKKHKHIDISEGTLIRALAYILNMKEFWKPKEEQSVDLSEI